MFERVLVTGGCGFIGSEVVRQLVASGRRVRVLDDLSSPESRPPGGCEFVRVNLAEPDPTRDAFEGFDACVNLAAKIGGIGYFHKYLATILSENNRIYSSTFEAAAAVGLERMVYVSSSMVFESTTRFPSRESDLGTIPPPVTAYGFRKLVGEWYCRAFAEEHGLPCTIVRPFNAYGVNEAPGDEVGYAHVIPDLIKKILHAGDAIDMLGDGQQTRCFTHVADLARGMLAALDCEEAAGEDFNLSHTDEVRIIDLARTLMDLCGRPGLAVRHVAGFQHDVPRRVPDVSKARRVLGWEAREDFRTRVAEVIDWIRQREGIAP